jgi:hypothetical protein
MIILSSVGIISNVQFSKKVDKYLSLSNKLNVIIGILIKYLTVTVVLLLRFLRLIYCQQAAVSLSATATVGSPDGTELAIGVYVSGLLDFIESIIVAPNLLVSYIKSKFSEQKLAIWDLGLGLWP